MTRDFLQRNRVNLVVAGTIFFSYVLLHLLFQRHELLAYDMYTYTSFAEHYAENWFHTIMPDQAGGLEIVSYPPLVFQSMALLSFLPLLNYTTISILGMSSAVTFLSFSVYTFVKEVSDLKQVKDEKYMAVITLLVGFSPGLMKFSLLHGQLPFITGLGFVFLGSTYFYRTILGEQQAAKLAAAVILTAYIHHFSALTMVIAFTIISLVNFKEFTERISYLIPVGFFSGIAVITGLFPMLRETLFGVSQGVIAHGSRTPFISQRVMNQFVTTTYGLTILGAILTIKRGSKTRLINIIALVFMALGLGLTTPLAEILLSGLSDFIVYDKFSLLASLLFISLIGIYASERLKHRKLITVVVSLFIITSISTTLWANNIHYGSFTGYEDYNSEQSNKAIHFLNHNASKDHLYMTLGHGTHIGEIQRNTELATLDTGYYQGRNHGLLQDQGKFDRIRDRNEFYKITYRADNLSLKYVFTFQESKENWLDVNPAQNGELHEWKRVYLGDGVTAWINPDAKNYSPDLGEKRLLFGFIPPIATLVSILLFFSSRTKKRFNQGSKRIEKLLESLSSKKITSWVPVLGLPILAAAPSLVTSGYPSGIDTPAHLFKVELMTHMIAEYGKIFYWTDWWYNGYPFQAMYSPLSAYAISILYSLTDNITVAYNVVRLAATAGLSVIIYLLTDEFATDKRVRIIASALVAFSYPIYNNLYTVGRMASAVALPLYFLIILILLRDDIFQKDISKGHICLGLTAAILFLTHSMMAYLFIYTGIIFCLVYRDEIVKIGVKPVLVTFALPLILSSPYIIRFIQHFSVTDPSWFVLSQEFSISSHLVPEYNIIPPTFIGWIHAAFLGLGLKQLAETKDRLLVFSLANFSFFFVTFWARNSKIAYYLPLWQQFDLARFEILFAAFGIIIAAYGLEYLFNYLDNVKSNRKNILAAVLVLLVILQGSPMLIQSSNWSPEFKEEINRIDINQDYRAMGVDMRQWDTYLLWEMKVPNTFGWFNQANPNPLYTESLQRSGGRWHGWNFKQDIDNPDFRKNLMELSNTKYIISAEGEWMNPDLKQQVKGLDLLNHHLNDQLITNIREDEEFKQIYDSNNLDVYELEREMSYCEGIKPIWIERDYQENSIEFLKKGNITQEIPVKGSKPNKPQTAAEGVKCSKTNPYSISVEVDEPGWVLVKESKYPFWKAQSGETIRNGFGFMAIYVDGSEYLRYNERDVSTLIN